MKNRLDVPSNLTDFCHWSKTSEHLTRGVREMIWVRDTGSPERRNGFGLLVD
ncbi:hypothetical protein C1646_770438 [Rhizophagus diaphanus]|nr:hypothetical protein C1646_770438 [Rhizophagus diaphanus] [Rhizophagus sp. MUCL 43196]